RRLSDSQFHIRLHMRQGAFHTILGRIHHTLIGIQEAEEQHRDSDHRVTLEAPRHTGREHRAYTDPNPERHALRDVNEQMIGPGPRNLAEEVARSARDLHTRALHLLACRSFPKQLDRDSSRSAWASSLAKLVGLEGLVAYNPGVLPGAWLLRHEGS